MALEIQNKRIVGEIDNLQDKLDGKLPVDRLELLYLVNSWGRDYDFYTNENIIIPKCEATQCYDLSKLDTSEIIDMNGLFKYSMFNNIHSTNGIGLHNGDISSWNVSSVTNMEYMFNSSSNFNQSLNSWDVSNVKNMYMMFYRAKEFNQVLNDWDVSSVTNMSGMFRYATNFDQDISSWDVSKVTDMHWMFYSANNFNQALNNWDVSNVTDMNYMFRDASNFNQVLNNWDVSNVTDIRGMFYNAIAFEMKFNNGKPLPEEANELKFWFNNNRNKMLAIDIKVREKDNLDSFFNNLNNINNDIDSRECNLIK